MKSLDQERIIAIRNVVKARRDELFAQHRWLEHQDALGMAIFLFASLGCVGLAVAYGLSAIPAWVCVVGVALLCSLLHEIEHDVIHDLYFRQHKRIQDVMLLFSWLLRANIINPWMRRIIHLHHHRVSGSTTDIEEIAATNGIPMGLRRLLMMTSNTSRRLLAGRRLRGFFIDGVEVKHSWRDTPERLFDLLMFVWLGLCLARGGAAVLGAELWLPNWAAPAVAVVDFLAVVTILPNVLRRFCLFFITSNNHFHGDVEGLLQQTQVLNHWVFLPFNLFCFNFGATHAIHHIVVRQPFYVRQWVAPAAFRAMKENGVRFNDFGTFLRANRYRKDFRVENLQRAG